MTRIVGWFSCGNNSAVMCRLLTIQYSEANLRLCRCVVANEHPDNDRFHSDVENWIGRPIERLQSDKFKDCWEVWEKRKYLAGIKGAPCTVEMKKAVRWKLEQEWHPDYQSFGFSSDEKHRSERFIQENPEIRLLRPLEDSNITKAECANIIQIAGIELPVMYKLGFRNNNCIGCVKASSVAYWIRVRHFFPEQYYRMVNLSFNLNCRLAKHNGERIFLHEIPDYISWDSEDDSQDVECGVSCSAQGGPG